MLSEDVLYTPSTLDNFLSSEIPAGHFGFGMNITWVL